MRWLAVGEAGKEGGDGVPPQPIGVLTEDAQVLELGEAVGRHLYLPHHRLQFVPASITPTSWQRRTTPAGVPGELWVRGPQVMDGYRGAPEETAPR